MLRIRCKQLFHIGKILLTRLYSLVVALQADIESVGKEQAPLLRCVGVVAVHAGRRLRGRRVLYRRGLQIFDDLLVTFPAKFGNGSLQHVPLVRHVRGMAVRASAYCGLMPKFRIRQPRPYILMASQTHLRACNPQHPGDVPAMWVVACNTGPDGKRPVGETTLEFIFCMALEADRFGCSHQVRRSPVNWNLMAKHAHLPLGQQTLHFR